MAPLILMLAGAFGLGLAAPHVFDAIAPASPDTAAEDEARRLKRAIGTALGLLRDGFPHLAVQCLDATRD